MVTPILAYRGSLFSPLSSLFSLLSFFFCSPWNSSAFTCPAWPPLAPPASTPRLMPLSFRLGAPLAVAAAPPAPLRPLSLLFTRSLRTAPARPPVTATLPVAPQALAQSSDRPLRPLQPSAPAAYACGGRCKVLCVNDDEREETSHRPHARPSLAAITRAGYIIARPPLSNIATSTKAGGLASLGNSFSNHHSQTTLRPCDPPHLIRDVQVQIVVEQPRHAGSYNGRSPLPLPRLRLRPLPRGRPRPALGPHLLAGRGALRRVSHRAGC